MRRSLALVSGFSSAIPNEHIGRRAMGDNRIGMRGSFVYFLLCDSEAVKIGFAKNIANRIRDIQCGNHRPVILVGFYWVADPKAEEAGLHERFEDERIRGEWFALSVELVEAICFARECKLMQQPSAFDSLGERLREAAST